MIVLHMLLLAETVVHLSGTGKGGRNQELALAAAEGIAGLKDTAIFSIGSDGTDGPTDAAGGYCDGDTKERLTDKGIDIYQVLQDNNAYMALEEAGGLIKTGATGTNVNDVAVLLIKREGEWAGDEIHKTDLCYFYFLIFRRAVPCCHTALHTRVCLWDGSAVCCIKAEDCAKGGRKGGGKLPGGFASVDFFFSFSGADGVLACYCRACRGFRMSDCLFPGHNLCRVRTCRTDFHKE